MNACADTWTLMCRLHPPGLLPEGLDRRARGLLRGYRNGRGHLLDQHTRSARPACMHVLYLHGHMEAAATRAADANRDSQVDLRCFVWQLVTGGS